MPDLLSESETEKNNDNEEVQQDHFKDLEEPTNTEEQTNESSKKI